MIDSFQSLFSQCGLFGLILLAAGSCAILARDNI
jgi:hypothetical protein